MYLIFILLLLLPLTILCTRLNSMIWTLIAFELINIGVLFYFNSFMVLFWFLFLLTLQVSESLILLSLLIIDYRLI